MCGRYVLVLSEDGMGQLIREQDVSKEWMAQLEAQGHILQQSSTVRPAIASYNIAPTHVAPIVVNREGRRDLEFARWGFVPNWWRQPEFPKQASFNARSDRLKESGFWRGALNHHRCMVPASGFYEWRRVRGERHPYYIHRSDGRLMSFAGLFSYYTNRESGVTESTFAIITTPTNDFMEPLHDRIPLVMGDVEDELWSVWLDPKTKFDDVERFVTSREWPEMSMHRVSMDVNPTGKAGYVNDPYLIEPISHEEQGAFM